MSGAGETDAAASLADADATDQPPVEGHPTALLDEAVAARLAEATARTEDFSELSPEVADALAQQAHPAVDVSDAPTMADVHVGEGDVTLAAFDGPATAHDPEAQPTAVERHPVRAHEVDTHAARAALDAKIRAHLDSGASKRDDPLIGETVGGRFEIVSRIGEGGMGAVYRARQQGIDRDVAVKVLLQELTSNETLTRRFTIEALAVSRLKHPHTIQIFDFGKTELGNLYIAMELLEGDTLYGVHRKERRLPVRRALRIIAQVAGSLAEAHGKDIVHRDLKPENIFLTRVGQDHDFVKVLDFGVAKLRDGAGDGKGTLTKAGSIFGTPRYMSPEQASARPVDARSDLYALGIILYELIVGHPPFQSDTPLTLLLAHVNDTPQAPSAAAPDIAVPLEVEDLILTLLAKSPDDRLQSAAELQQRCRELSVTLPEAFEQAVPLDEAAALGVALSAPATVHVPAQGLPADTRVEIAPETQEAVPEPPRRRGALVVGVVLALLGVVGGVLLLNSGGRSEPAVAAASQTPAPLPATSAPPTPKAPTRFTVQVTSSPAGASVLDRDGHKLLGKTPLSLTRDKGEALTVRVELEGHVSQRAELRFDRERSVALILPEQPKAPPPAEPPRAPAEPLHAKNVDAKKLNAKKVEASSPRRKAARASAGKASRPPPPTKKAEAAKPPPKKQDPGLVDDLM